MIITEFFSMALPYGDNVYTKFFTPEEFQVELLNNAKKGNIVACVGNVPARTFVAVKLIEELLVSRLSRGDGHKNAKLAIFLVESYQNAAHYASAITHLTDLKMMDFSKNAETDFLNIPHVNILLANSSQILSLIMKSVISIDSVILIVVDDCHYSLIQSHSLSQVMRIVLGYPDVKILGLTQSLYKGDDNDAPLIETFLDNLESAMGCKVDTACEITNILRYNHKPREYFVEYEECFQDDLRQTLENEVISIMGFLKDHRYDPSELFEGDLLEEMKAIPDPLEDPMNIIQEFLYILNTMGSWCAHKAALFGLIQVEKLKLKTAFERHFLLLCLMSSLFLKIRMICEGYFSQFNPKEKMRDFLSPKMNKLINILVEFKPTKGEKVRNDPEDDRVMPTCVNTLPTMEDSYIKYKADRTRFRRYKHRKNFMQKRPSNRNKGKSTAGEEDGNICCIIIVGNRLVSNIIHYVLSDLKKHDEENFWWVKPQFAVEKTANLQTEPLEAETQHRYLEDVLKKFRCKECNIMIGTSMLEEGIEYPRCNLVVRYDVPSNFESYIHSKGKANANPAHFFILFGKLSKNLFVEEIARYYKIEQLLLNRCNTKMETDEEVKETDAYNKAIIPYKICKKDKTSELRVENAIACLNRYCAKLPSDTFTRLTPTWKTWKMNADDEIMYCTSVKLPINSPFKEVTTGHPMPTKLLSKRVAALETCRRLHLLGELDDNLKPIGKESFHLMYSVADDVEADEEDKNINMDDPRPGTNKRRKCYKKRIAGCFRNCMPIPHAPLNLYYIRMTLSCPLPEEQNTRGRRIYAPECFPNGFALLLTTKVPRVCSFPIYTRSGEEMINLELCQEGVKLSEEQLDLIRTFVRYMFSNVIRLKKYYMMFNPEKSDQNFFVVPIRGNDGEISIDWNFLRIIDEQKDQVLTDVPEEERKRFVYSDENYKDAIVVPWYRNKISPQYFYVAEICSHLSPLSKFPTALYESFEEYYRLKYGINVQNMAQSMLDVDHVAARLNFLTPRYVNRKGVALPTCSESTKKAKRESLEQKQILVPELCLIHPFSASMWRKAVSLPCILYRLNALILAEEIRRTVATDMCLGVNHLPSNHTWPPLDFGWTLRDVVDRMQEWKMVKVSRSDSDKEVDDGSTKDKILECQEKSMAMEIGTWSNEMASGLENSATFFEPPTMRYGSPTSWINKSDQSDLDSCSTLSDSCNEDEIASDCSKGIRIEFKNEYLAEAFDELKDCDDLVDGVPCIISPWFDSIPHDSIISAKMNFESDVAVLKEEILTCGKVIDVNQTLTCVCKILNNKSDICEVTATLPWILNGDTGYAASYEKKRNNMESNFVAVSLHEENTNHDEESLPSLGFSFDYQPDLTDHPGPSPNILLQALTMSNANDGLNLERLETIGDSFLKYAVTTYLYCTYEGVHEGKLSHIRSKLVSNLRLYRLGKLKHLGELMISMKFEPHDNWLPTCFCASSILEEAMIRDKVSSCCFWPATRLQTLWKMSVHDLTLEQKARVDEYMQLTFPHSCRIAQVPKYLPFHLVTQHWITDKAVADCVEALIGTYLISCGIRGATLFLAWLGISVLPQTNDNSDGVKYGYIALPPSPMLQTEPNTDQKLSRLICGFDAFENIIGYKFKDKSYLLQAMTHASFSTNCITDCYQRLEFLGDAVLDYLITRHLYEDKRQHSPGALTDLRSALVNNTIFASLAIKFNFHRYFKHSSPGLSEVIHKFVRLQQDNKYIIFEDYFLIHSAEDTKDSDEVEDVEVPKALGDIFESVAGAIFLDSGMSLDSVWRVYYQLMKHEIDVFSMNVPKSPIRELLEMEPETAKFGRPEKLADGKKVRVTVEIFGKGTFKGIGRSYRIAKCTAAKCALKHLKRKGLMPKKPLTDLNLRSAV